MPAVKQITSKDDLPLIDAEFEAYLPARTPEEAAELESLIVAAGEADPLIVWAEPNILVDGYGRFAILKKHKLPVSVVYRDFADREAVLKWIVRHQLARRNLNDQQRAYFIGKMYEARKGARGGSKDHTDPLNENVGNTAEKVASQAKVGPATVKRAGAFAAAVDAAEAVEPGAKANILAGKAGSMAKVIATAPKLCTRCKRVGAVRGCPECEKLNKARTSRTSGSRPPKSGRVLTDWKGLEQCIGKLARVFDGVFKSLGKSHADKDFAEANGAINNFLRVIERVKKAQK